MVGFRGEVHAVGEVFEPVFPVFGLDVLVDVVVVVGLYKTLHIARICGAATDGDELYVGIHIVDERAPIAVVVFLESEICFEVFRVIEFCDYYVVFVGCGECGEHGAEDFFVLPVETFLDANGVVLNVAVVIAFFDGGIFLSVERDEFTLDVFLLGDLFEFCPFVAVQIVVVF